MNVGRPHAAAALLALAALVSARDRPATAQGGTPPPLYKVDPSWPQPLPIVRDRDGQAHPWVTGEVGATCVDRRDHVITVNRGFLKGGLIAQEGRQSVPAPPVIEFDADGKIVNTWGDAALTPQGAAATLPHGIHGCFVDYEDNVWIAGNLDGVVQKWTHDGKQMLLQIGTKGACDGPPTTSPNAPYPTCGEPGTNTSRTLLNDPADVFVDPNPDPATGERGSVYIADGYGNYRVVVFDSRGNYLRQWGTPGSDPGQFGARGGGHPHCVLIGVDGLVYTCDRGQNRVQVFDKLGTLRRVIPIDPPDQKSATARACDLAFSQDPTQTFMYVTDLGSDRVWILDREKGAIVGSLGRPGHMAGELTFPHTVAVDSKGDVYVSETIGGRRSQKFVRI
jgi:hypothetical protein